MKVTKRNKALNANIDRTKEYTIDEAVKLLKELSTVKFSESLDCAIRLGVEGFYHNFLIPNILSLTYEEGNSSFPLRLLQIYCFSMNSFDHLGVS